jgi:outer membrane immunogenic protein
MFMKKLVLAAVAALGLFATPALANDFTGPRLSVVAGLDKQADVTGVSVGVVGGYDVTVTGPVRAGVEVTVAESTVDLAGVVRSNLDLGANLRVGVKVAGPVLAFGKVGYARTDYGVVGFNTTVEGLRYGGGLEVALTDRLFATAEYARTEYGAGVPARDQGLVGLGLRF